VNPEEAEELGIPTADLGSIDIEAISGGVIVSAAAGVGVSVEDSGTNVSVAGSVNYRSLESTTWAYVGDAARVRAASLELNR